MSCLGRGGVGTERRGGEDYNINERELQKVLKKEKKGKSGE